MADKVGRKLGGLVETRDISEGDSFTAIYIRTKEVPFEDGPRKLHHFRENGDAALFGVWGSTNLNAAMGEAVPGMELKVTRLPDGKKKKGRNALKLFDVEVIKDMDVAG